MATAPWSTVSGKQTRLAEGVSGRISVADKMSCCELLCLRLVLELLYFGVFRSSAIEQHSTSPIVDVVHGASLLFGIGHLPLPLWGQ